MAVGSPAFAKAFGHDFTYRVLIRCHQEDTERTRDAETTHGSDRIDTRHAKHGRTSPQNKLHRSVNQGMGHRVYMYECRWRLTSERARSFLRRTHDA